MQRSLVLISFAMGSLVFAACGGGTGGAGGSSGSGGSAGTGGGGAGGTGGSAGVGGSGGTGGTPALGWTSAIAAIEHTCGIKTDGSLWCWGASTNSQLGFRNFPLFRETSPVAVGTDVDWDIVDGGREHGCAIKSGGTLWCWGLNTQGQVGDGTGTRADAPTQIGAETTWTQISTGADTTCGIRGGALYCWGSGSDGQLADGNAVAGTKSESPLQVGTDTDWDWVSAGLGQVCGIRGGMLYCWGRNFYGQLGDGTNGDQLTPYQIGVAANWASVDAGRLYSCGTHTDNTLWCWGFNSRGQLGDTTTANKNDATTQVGTDTDWAWVHAGSTHTCARKSDNTIWCWGNNDDGQLGDGGSTETASPQQVGSATDWRSVYAGGAFSCAVKNDDTLWCWGDNADGSLGQGGVDNSSTPIEVSAQ